jgi:PilZ domain
MMIELEKNAIENPVGVTEHRQSPRYSFSCDAEVIDIQSNARIIGRVTDIARRGCYVDCISPFPPGTLLAVKIRRGIQTFETQGSVVYSTVGLGMGLCFTVTEQPHALLLEAWLSELSGDKQPELESVGSAAPVAFSTTSSPASSSDFVDVQSRNILKELIRLLRRNGALGESDSAVLLEKLRK